MPEREGVVATRSALLGILALALAVRVLALVLIAPSTLVNDESLYRFEALELVRGGALGDAHGRAPASIVFYAVLAKFFGPSVNVSRAGNVVLGTVIVWLVYALGRRVGGRRTGLVAAVLCAIYPTLVGFSHYLWAETLYLVFVLGALLLVLRYRERPTSWKLVGAGLSLGLSALTREVGLAAALGVAGFLIWDARADVRRGVAAATVVLAICAATVAPWSLHLYRTTGDVVLVTRTSWLTLYLGNASPHSFHLYKSMGASRSEREAAARSRVLRAISARLPWWPFEKLVELRDFFAPTSYVVRRLLLPAEPRGSIGSWRYRFRWSALDPDPVRRAAALAAVLSYVGVAIFGVVGLVFARNPAAVGLFAAYALSQVAPTLIAFANSRFRLPLMPILLIGAAIVVGSLPDAWRAASQGRRTLAVLGALVMAGLIGWGYSTPLARLI